MSVKRIRNIAYLLGGLLMLAGACLVITRWQVAPYLFLSGAFLFGWAQVTEKYTGGNFVIRRLRRQQLMATFLLVLTGVLMLTLRHNEWVISLLVAAVIELYVSFRIPQEQKKDMKKD